MHAIGSLLRGLFSLASWLMLIAVVLKIFFVDVVEVPHNGMAPTLVFGEKALVWRRANVDMGDVVVCEHPSNPAASVLGRAIAFAGHTVSTERGNLMVDNDRASVEWEGEVRFFDVTREKLFTMRLGSVDYNRQNRHDFIIERETDLFLRAYQVNRGVYLLGDNRSDPIDDSREFGEVDPAKCKGQVFMRFSLGDARVDDIHHGWLAVVQ